jgi:ribonuclease HI
MINYTIYTDGAYKSSLNTGGIGIVFLRNNEKVFEYSCKYQDTTNQRMEMQAILVALNSIVKEIDTLTIITDSMYVVGTLTKNWKRKANNDLWDKIDLALSKAQKLVKNNIQFNHVKGHNGDKYNEQCDKLASEACYEVEY